LQPVFGCFELMARSTNNVHFSASVSRGFSFRRWDEPAAEAESFLRNNLAKTLQVRWQLVFPAKTKPFYKFVCLQFDPSVEMIGVREQPRPTEPVLRLPVQPGPRSELQHVPIRFRPY